MTVTASEERKECLLEPGACGRHSAKAREQPLGAGAAKCPGFPGMANGLLLIPLDLAT